MKKAFTLVEMLIVVGITMLLLAATMGFGLGYLKSVQAKIAKENLMSSYSLHHSRALSSSMIMGKRFSLLIVNGLSGSNKLNFIYSGSVPLSEYSLLEGLVPEQDIYIQIAPLGKTCDPNQEKYSFKTSESLGIQKKTCFGVEKLTCRLKEISCE